MNPIAAVSPVVAGADTLTSATLPVADAGDARWYFCGDKVVGLIQEAKGADCVGHFNAYSLAEPKALWHVDQILGSKDLVGNAMVFPDAKANQWYVGNGPFSKLDLNAGTIQWTIPCDQSGYVIPASARLFPGDRILVTGSTKCKQGSDWDAMKEPSFAMINSASGQVVWRHETKGLEYENSLGYWARLDKVQGGQVENDKRLQLVPMFVTPNGDYDVTGVYQPDRLAIAGEEWESVRLSDGTPLFKTKDKPGILRGAYGGMAFFRDGDKLNAYTTNGAAPTWSFDLEGKGATVYTVDDLAAQGHGVPDAMGDIIISESDVVSRVSIETGRAVWTIKRKGMGWWGSKHAFITVSGNKATAYDWKAGTKMWEVKVDGKPKPTDSGDYIVFVGADKVDNGVRLPPYRFTTVRGAGGQVLWSRKDIEGRKVVDWRLVSTDQIRLTSDKGAIANVKLADGSPAEPPPATAKNLEEGVGEGGFFVTYLDKQKALQCHNYAGKLVWERKGDNSMLPAYTIGKGCVVWASTDGTVEVIGLSDGASKWKTKVDAKKPHPLVNTDGTYMVIQNKQEVSIVKLGP